MSEASPLDEKTATTEDYVHLWRRWKLCKQSAHLVRIASARNARAPSRQNREAELLAEVDWHRNYAEYLDAGGRLVFADF